MKMTTKQAHTSQRIAVLAAADLAAAAGGTNGVVHTNNFVARPDGIIGGGR